MKGLIQIRIILMFITALAFTGCAQLAVNTSRKPTPVPNIDADAIITFTKGKLHHVTPRAPKRRGEVFTWKVVPPNKTVTICIKDKQNNPVPFIEKDWNDDRCITRNDNSNIKGTIRNDLEIPNGVRVIEYSVLDKKGNLIIDPDILVY